MDTSSLLVEIDVANAHLDSAMRPSGEQWTVAHDESRIAGLVARLVGLAPSLVVLEATGHGRPGYKPFAYRP